MFGGLQLELLRLSLKIHVKMSEIYSWKNQAYGQEHISQKSGLLCFSDLGVANAGENTHNACKNGRGTELFAEYHRIKYGKMAENRFVNSGRSNNGIRSHKNILFS